MTKIVKTVSGSIYIVHDDGRVVRDGSTHLLYSGDLKVVGHFERGGRLITKDTVGYNLISSPIQKIVEV